MIAIEGVQTGAAPDAQHTAVAAIPAIEAVPLAVADRLQAQPIGPPQRQMQRQQQPLDARQGGDLAGLQPEAPGLLVLVGGLGPDALAVLAHPIRAGRSVGKEPPGLLGRAIPVDRQEAVAPPGVLEDGGRSREALPRAGGQLGQALDRSGARR